MKYFSLAVHFLGYALLAVVDVRILVGVMVLTLGRIIDDRTGDAE